MVPVLSGLLSASASPPAAKAAETPKASSAALSPQAAAAPSLLNQTEFFMIEQSRFRRYSDVLLLRL